MNTNLNHPVQSGFERKVSLTTSLIAVALSILTIYSNILGDDLLISRGSANNRWAYFQSKSIKQNLFKTQLKVLYLEQKRASQDSAFQVELQKQIVDFEANCPI